MVEKVAREVFGQPRRNAELNDNSKIHLDAVDSTVHIKNFLLEQVHVSYDKDLLNLNIAFAVFSFCLFVCFFHMSADFIITILQLTRPAQLASFSWEELTPSALPPSLRLSLLKPWCHPIKL